MDGKLKKLDFHISKDDTDAGMRYIISNIRPEWDDANIIITVSAHMAICIRISNT